MATEVDYLLERRARPACPQVVLGYGPYGCEKLSY